MTRRSNQRYWVVISIVLMAFVSPISAKVIYVDDDGPADFNNVQAAINDAIHGDTVIVADGVYAGPGNQDIDFKGKAITVRSENGPKNCIIDCQWLAAGFSFHSGEDNGSVLDGFSITQGGWAKNGIMCEDYSNPTITNCMITRTTHGIFVTNKNTSKIINCVTTNNSGSGIVSFDSSPTITNCTIINNGMSGITCYWHSTPQITNSILRGNSSPQIDTYPGNIATVTYSNVQGGWAGAGNIDTDPCFAASSYYRLMPNSACIDAGTNVPVGGLPQLDIEGYPRPTDGDNDSVAVADMGAYESWPPSEPVIWLSKWELVFIAKEGGPNPPEQILTIHNSGAGTINWIISHNCQWLEVDPNTGSSSGQANDVVLRANVNGLPAGKYNGFLTVSGPSAINTPQVISVSLYVGTPSIAVASTEVYFLYPVGAPAPEPQTFSIWNDAAGRLDWRIIEDCNWLQVDPNTGSSTGEANEVTLSVDVSGLAPNIYNCQLAIIAEKTVNSPRIVQVFLHIYDNNGILHVPSPYRTIQAAINTSVTGNEIIVSPGTYYENINFGGKNITLRSTDPTDPCVVANTVIDRRGEWGAPVVTFSGTESASCTLSGFTITHGQNYKKGGGIFGNGTLATIQYNIISENQAVGSWFVSGRGGGLYDCDGTIQYNVISRNQAVADIESYGAGGGLYGCDGTIKNNIIMYNQAVHDGGGLADSHGTILNNTIVDNSAGWGGGFYGCDGTIKNNITVYNQAFYDGGGLADCHGTIWNNTIYGNSAYQGGGLHNCYGYIKDCIIWGNSGGQIYHSVYALYITYSDIEGGYAGEGNIDADPCFVEIGYLDDNGTPFDLLDDFYLEGDYHLKSQAGRWDPNSKSWVRDDVTSPCIDAANPGCPVGDEPDPNGNRKNMGAYGGTAEASKSPTYWRSIADITNDWIVDSNDLKVFVGYWLQTGECIPGDFDRSRSVDFNDFAIFAGQWRQIGPGPGITYKVDECIPIESPLSAAGESEPTRFTVTVEGNNIHFEDLITANCCADEIELLMTVEAGLITIYEIEHTPMPPCPCICDYPTTATLGPFDPGTYILEVYQGAGFIGATTVTIGPAR